MAKTIELKPWSLADAQKLLGKLDEDQLQQMEKRLAQPPTEDRRIYIGDLSPEAKALLEAVKNKKK